MKALPEDQFKAEEQQGSAGDPAGSTQAEASTAPDRAIAGPAVTGADATTSRSQTVAATPAQPQRAIQAGRQKIAAQINTERLRYVEAWVLARWLSDQQERFRRIGSDAFLQVVNHVSPANRKLFTSAFDKLVAKHGCREEILFECLFLFCNGASDSLQTILPTKEEVHALQRDLQRVAVQIGKLNKSNVIDALCHYTGERIYCEPIGDAIEKAKSPPERLVGAFETNREQNELLRLITWYQRNLDIWLAPDNEAPRNDIFRRYGRIAISLYPNIASGAFDHKTVAEIQNCFNWPIDYDNLRKNVNYFTLQSPEPFSDLQAKLRDLHDQKERELTHLKEFMVGDPLRIHWNSLFDPKGTKGPGAAAGKV